MGPSEEDIVEEYPEIFTYYELTAEEFDEQYGSPPPSITLFGFQHQSGWNHLVRGLCEYLERQDRDIRIVQCKEKFGGLRVYTSSSSSESEVDERRTQQMFGAVQMAQEMSFQVCECCGSPGELRNDGGWMKTRCDECLEAED